jgi:four helix bundle protein
MIERFEDIVAWQHGRALCRDIYLMTERQPFARDFALRDQIRKAAISVPSNIAEGFERFRLTEFHQFLSIAKGSAGELRTQLYIASDIGYIQEQTRATLLAKAEETSRKINALRSSIQRKMNAP